MMKYVRHQKADGVSAHGPANINGMALGNVTSARMFVYANNWGAHHD
jgi:hypothetical protein